MIPEHPPTVAPAPTHIVLIPGFMCDHTLWQAIQPELQQWGALQLAGITQDSDINAMAERILPQLPARCDLIGFSLGGYVARRIAVLAPERVRRLVLLNTSARASTVAELAANQQQIRMLQTFPFRGQTRSALMRAMHPQRPDAALLQHLQQMSRSLGAEVFMRQLSIVRADGHDELRRITCPVLVIASRDDQMRSLQEADNILAALPNGRLHIIDDCGHMSPLEQPVQLLQLLQAFLRPEFI
ncbi:alpha/beta fold hydrolase [Undibacterium oligocarboniphilum]|uniref:Alpha/beta hydrolase n=1 Tax=Undibacterium oligocarboniphilum TaxID=666702 RepID=A0A850QAS6_9BURK|nr:alpha/beta hydrolase [Undibacterium oligocarboniphilum]MBC3870988.1 alpha/beta hydrolase [Undibacterium oligocarboniphilum]NVO76389.1 alpha/beta hydrolase [Undibacterium oligocarboniphilum]